MADEQTPDSAAGAHAAADGAPLHPLIDLSRDPTPGVPDHALADDAAAQDGDAQNEAAGLPGGAALEDPDEFTDR
jgi:hypothetical protein